MKKQKILLAITAMFLTFSSVKAQNVSRQEVVIDTVNISIGNHQINSNKHIIIGQMKAYDPEKSILNYSIKDQEIENLFHVTKKGILWAEAMQLIEYCSHKDFKVAVMVSDGFFERIAIMLVQVKCI